ncbi:MAG: alpha/beta hydrolase [Oscillospiraceae bacterium]|nr:alpha/beta hydrolase [Oscillospiraceae bacterium]
MQYREYGKQNKDVIILLHGGGLSCWNYREAAEHLQEEFHVVIPALDGHAGSDSDFTTIENNASEIISFIDDKFGGSVLLIGGLSLGGQILLEILSQRKDICRFAIIESALIIPSPLTRLLIRPAFGSAYGLIGKKWFSKLQFQSLRINRVLFDDYYRDTCAITKKNMIAFLQANAMYFVKESIRASTAEIHIYYGEKENGSIRRSAEKLHSELGSSKLHRLPGLHHGEFSINYADRYVKELETIMKRH